MSRVVLPVTPLDAGQEIIGQLVTLPPGTASVAVCCVPGSDALSLDESLALTLRYQRSRDNGATWTPYVTATRPAGPLPDDLDWHAPHAVGEPGGSIPLVPGATFELVRPGGDLSGTVRIVGEALPGDVIRAQVACQRVGGAALGLVVEALDADNTVIDW